MLRSACHAGAAGAHDERRRAGGHERGRRQLQRDERRDGQPQGAQRRRQHRAHAGSVTRQERQQGGSHMRRLWAGVCLWLRPAPAFALAGHACRLWEAGACGKQLPSIMLQGQALVLADSAHLLVSAHARILPPPSGAAGGQGTAGACGVSTYPAAAAAAPAVLSAAAQPRCSADSACIAPPRAQVRAVCSSNGQFVRQPSGSFEYEGGEVRLVVVSSACSLDTLKEALDRVVNRHSHSKSMSGPPKVCTLCCCPLPLLLPRRQRCVGCRGAPPSTLRPLARRAAVCVWRMPGAAAMLAGVGPQKEAAG